MVIMFNFHWVIDVSPPTLGIEVCYTMLKGLLPLILLVVLKLSTDDSRTSAIQREDYLGVGISHYPPGKSTCILYVPLVVSLYTTITASLIDNALPRVEVLGAPNSGAPRCHDTKLQELEVASHLPTMCKRPRRKDVCERRNTG